MLTWLTTAAGGAERSTLELAHGLRNIIGFDVVVVWWNFSGCLVAPAPRPTVPLRQVTDLRSYRRALQAELAADPTGTLLIGTHRTTMVDVPIARDLGVTVIPVLRGILVAGHGLRTVDPASGRLVPRAPEELDWDLLAEADCWVGVSRAAASSVLEHSPHPLRVHSIHNGVPIPPHPPIPRGRPARRFSVVSRIEPWKRIDRVIAAFASLPASLAGEARLNVFGDGPALPRLRDLVDALRPAGEVVFRGYVPDRWQAETDVLVSACDIEGFGRVVVEAGATGIPQIVPDRGGSAELVLPRTTGLVHSAGDLRALTAALAEALTWSGHQLEAMARRAHVHARSFSHTRYVSAYASLATQLSSPAPPASLLPA
ncbi:glycosyltransferase [Spirillospora sp. NBC_00431]